MKKHTYWTEKEEKLAKLIVETENEECQIGYFHAILPAVKKIFEFYYNKGEYFKSLQYTQDDFWNDIYSDLWTMAHRFNPGKGSRAFSFYTVCIKNRLIKMAGKKYTQLVRTCNSIDDPTSKVSYEALTKVDPDPVHDLSPATANDELVISQVLEFVKTSEIERTYRKNCLNRMCREFFKLNKHLSPDIVRKAFLRAIGN